MPEQKEHGIAWTERTWNPTRGCSRISPGCVNCYAEKIASRFNGPGAPFEGFAHKVNGHAAWTGKVELIESKLLEPLSWRKPQRVFVNSMSDLFHEALSFEDIDKVFTTMIAAPQHVYQILTKRAERMREYFQSGRHDGGCGPDRATYHLDQQIWLGCSVEDRQRKTRIDSLRQTPAGLRFLSIEPLLEDIGILDLRGISWVIVGYESGPRPRPAEEQWVRNIKNQCVEAGVAFFYKQAATASGRKIPTPELDGQRWMQFPMTDGGSARGRG